MRGDYEKSARMCQSVAPLVVVNMLSVSWKGKYGSSAFPVRKCEKDFVVSDELNIAVPELWLWPGSGQGCSVELSQGQRAEQWYITSAGLILSCVGI